MPTNRVRVTGTDLDDLRVLIQRRPKQITEEAADELRLIGAQAVRDMRERVETADTKTGLSLGRQGRVRDKGESSLRNRPRVGGKSMRDWIDYRVNVNRMSVSLSFGWITGKPGYALFQDQGTSNGVRGMNALTDANVAAQIQLRRIVRKR